MRPAAGVECAKALYRKAGITDPRRQIDCAELYVSFGWFEPMWLECHLICGEGEGWKMVDSGATLDLVLFRRELIAGTRAMLGVSLTPPEPTK